MAKSHTHNQTAHVCTVCKREILLYTSNSGVNVMPNCAITNGCSGRMVPIHNKREKLDARTIPLQVTGLDDWYQRRTIAKTFHPNEQQTWIGVHNLGTVPSVEVYVMDGNKNLVKYAGDFVVEAIDRNTVKIHLESPKAGYAYYAASSSARDEAVVEEVQQASEIATFNSVVTIATKDLADDISISVSFEDKTIAYNDVSSIPSIQYPWGGVRRVFIDGMAYAVRTFNFETHEDPTPFRTNSIKPGDRVKFNISSAPGQNYILFAKTPYEAGDKNVNKVVDCYNLTEFTSAFYDGAEIVVPTSIISIPYPPVLF